MIGLVVNPVAGVGGPAGLAGSDGEQMQRLAAERGALPRAQERAITALRTLAAHRRSLIIATSEGAMGADAVRAAGLVPWVCHRGQEGLAAGTTSAADTAAAVAALADGGATLILVAGGDGTLRDAVDGLNARTGDGPEPAVLGIPSGVKMYSPVFAVSPAAAGALAADWLDGLLPTAHSEVLDVDEEAMRHARVEPVLHGMLRVPIRVGRTQARKAATPASEAAAVGAAARGAVAHMRPGTRYLLGPGSTTAEIARQLGVDASPLGVDVVLDGELLVSAASEQELREQVARGPAQAVVTVIGGQGFLLGRGNQQLSADVIRALGDDPLLVVAPEQKLVDLHGRALIVETGDAEIDARLSGHVRVITGVGTSSLYAVTAPDVHREPQTTS